MLALKLLTPVAYGEENGYHRIDRPVVCDGGKKRKKSKGKFQMWGRPLMHGGLIFLSVKWKYDNCRWMDMLLVI